MNKLISWLFPNRVWKLYGRAAAYSSYNKLSESGKTEVRRILGVKRFTDSVVLFEYKNDGIWMLSVNFSVPGDFKSYPPFIYDDPHYPGLAKTLRDAYE